VEFIYTISVSEYEHFSTFRRQIFRYIIFLVFKSKLQKKTYIKQMVSVAKENYAYLNYDKFEIQIPSHLMSNVAVVLNIKSLEILQFPNGCVVSRNR